MKHALVNISAAKGGQQGKRNDDHGGDVSNRSSALSEDLIVALLKEVSKSQLGI